MLPRAWLRSATMPLNVWASCPISSSLSTGAFTVISPVATLPMAPERRSRGLRMDEVTRRVMMALMRASRARPATMG